MPIRIHESANVENGVEIGPESQVWHNTQIREGAIVGSHCIIGRNVYIGPGISVGSNTKIQNNALIYEPAVISAGVFVGPGVILTNDHNPRAVTRNGALKTGSDWDAVGVTLLEGCSIGAGAVCVAPVRIGEWAMVGAGAVVISDVKNHALVVGNPAIQIGWVSTSGFRLIETVDGLVCPMSGEKFNVVNGELVKAN